jgi:hypothetical protein
MAQAEVRAVIRTGDDGYRELLVDIPSKYTCEGSFSKAFFIKQDIPTKAFSCGNHDA